MNHTQSKNHILQQLKQQSCQTASQLAERLSISVPAVRKHLGVLCNEGLIEAYEMKPEGRGRPQNVYSLTSKGENHFPKNYLGMCMDILDHLEELQGKDTVLHILELRQEKHYLRLKQQLEHLDFDSRVHALAELLREAGYHAQVYSEGDDFILEQNNCPSLEVAKRYKQLCQWELGFYEQLLHTKIERESQIVGGFQTCRYRIYKVL